METCYIDINAKATGAKIRALRKANGLTIREICTYMGFESEQAVYKWQRGASLPEIGNLIRLMALFHITDIRDIVVTTGDAEEASSVVILRHICRLT